CGAMAVGPGYFAAQNSGMTKVGDAKFRNDGGEVAQTLVMTMSSLAGQFHFFVTPGDRRETRSDLLYAFVRRRPKLAGPGSFAALWPGCPGTIAALGPG
ncbi:MAG: hypothetical protein AAFX02_07855, partial [Pseudomonadota bacterium]